MMFQNINIERKEAQPASTNITSRLVPQFTFFEYQSGSFEKPRLALKIRDEVFYFDTQTYDRVGNTALTDVAYRNYKPVKVTNISYEVLKGSSND